MKIDRPVWSAGALLCPQQFQQQARWEAWSNDRLAHLFLVHPWGVQAVAFDTEALRLGKLKATQLCLRMPDGTLVDSDLVDRLPCALELTHLLSGEVQDATVLLAFMYKQGREWFGSYFGERMVFFGEAGRRDLALYGENGEVLARTNPNAGPAGTAQPVVLDAEHLAQAMQDIDALWEAFYAQAGEVKNASA